MRDAAVPFIASAYESVAASLGTDQDQDQEENAEEGDPYRAWAAAFEDALSREHMVVPGFGAGLGVDRNGTGLVLKRTGVDALLSRADPLVALIADLEDLAVDDDTLTLRFQGADDVTLLYAAAEDAAAADATLTTLVLPGLRDARRNAAVQPLVNGLGGLAVAGAGALVLAGIVEAETAIATGTAIGAVLGTVASSVISESNKDDKQT